MRLRADKSPSLTWLIRGTLLLAVAAAISWAVHQGWASRLAADTLPWIRSRGAWGPLWFVLLYALATVAFLPGFLLTLGAGAIFGTVWGSIWVSLGSTIGATLSFLLARFVARDWVGKQVATRPRFRAIDEAVGRDGWKIVGLLRLSPVFPFNLLNYALGITRVSLPDYVLASWIGMMPGTILYVSIGALLGETVLAASAEPTARARTPAEWAVLGLGLVATVLVSVLIARLARAALARKLS